MATAWLRNDDQFLIEANYLDQFVGLMRNDEGRSYGQLVLYRDGVSGADEVHDTKFWPLFWKGLADGGVAPGPIDAETPFFTVKRGVEFGLMVQRDSASFFSMKVNLLLDIQDKIKSRLNALRRAGRMMRPCGPGKYSADCLGGRED